MAASLFPAMGGGARSSSASELVNLKAGKCVLTQLPNGNYSVVADPRRGTISMNRSNDRVLHFKWTDRTTGQVEDDRMIFPNSATFKKVRTPNETERVYVFTQDNQHTMFWMQDKASEIDAENASKINEFANNPAAVDAALAAAAAASNVAAGRIPGLPGLPGAAGGMGPEAWMNLMGLTRGDAGGPSAGTGTDAGGAPAIPGALDGLLAAGSGSGSGAAPNAFASLDLSSILSSLQRPGGDPPPPLMPSATSSDSASAPPDTAASPVAGGLSLENLRQAMAGVTPGLRRQRPLELQDILTGEGVLATGVLNDPAIRAELISHLPDGQQTEAFLETAIRSPQLTDALRSVSRALQGDNYASIMANIGVDPSPGTEHLIRGDPVMAFVTAMQAAARAQQQTPGQTQTQSQGGESGGTSSIDGGRSSSSDSPGDQMDDTPQ